MTTSLQGNDFLKTADRKRGGAESIEMGSSQISAKAAEDSNGNPSGFDFAENKKEAERKLKKKKANRTYYLANIGRLREKSRKRYSLALVREKESTPKQDAKKNPEKTTEKAGISRKPEIKSGSIPMSSVLLALIATVVVISTTKQGRVRNW